MRLIDIENSDSAVNLFRTVEDSCNDQTYFDSMLSTANCIGSSSCTINWTTSWFDSTCLSAKSSTHKAYLKMYCSGSEIPFPLQPYPKDAKVPIWICSLVVVVINAIILLVYFYYMRSQKKAEDQAIHYFECNKSYSTDYTVEVNSIS